MMKQCQFCVRPHGFLKSVRSEKTISLAVLKKRRIIIFNIMNIVTSNPTETTTYDLQTQVFKAFTHPTRLAILDQLRDGEHCVCHLEAHLGLRQAYISQQLSVLREAGLIVDRRDGWNVFYRVADERIFKLLDMLRMIAGAPKWEPLPLNPDCPCPKCTSQKCSCS